ncbi:hypothetical protein QJS10_CPB11g02186 [Acorus calamus]|uniref:Uncharacterized protein n=1 Tax=Acorus calamus TaxID=4465 RepID=A0AAV9DQP9_ACOCL|nr:hypothetical protein QJS10_CPB11g02186 [Acorus calamus]
MMGLKGREREEGKRMRVYSREYYTVCALGGMFSAGTTHLAITPLDVLKVNMQVNPVKYNGILSGLSTLLREQGPSVFWRGWAGKFYGYGAQGGCKFGLYEYFKKTYSDALVGYNKNAVYFLSSASAQVIADVTLCPFEAVKVCVQTQPKFAKAGYTSGTVGTIISNPADNIVSSLYNKKADSVWQAVKSIGFVNLFTRSLPIRIALVGPVVTSQWFFYDTIKLLTGLPPSGGIHSDFEEINSLG